jgi:Tol biopolymer transport system component
MRRTSINLSLVLSLGLAAWHHDGEAQPVKSRLAQTNYQLIYETYVDRNWELFVSNADGGEARNLTQTPDQNELYPQVSPDGSRICFIVDTGSGRGTVRSVYVMNMDGSERKKVSDHARQPCWTHDSDTLIYLPQEYPKWNVVDYYTQGLVYYDVTSGKKRPHPNSEKLHHLYNPSMSPDGQWIISTVHAGMGFGHAILLIEAEGDTIIDLEIPGCRPTFSPNGRYVAWGPGDHEVAVGEIDWQATPPRMGKKLLSVKDATHKVYHVDWAPNSQFLSISRGLSSDGDPSKPGTHQAACEMVGIYAKDWNILAVPLDQGPVIDLATAGPEQFTPITQGGHSHKESDWFEAAE